MSLIEKASWQHQIIDGAPIKLESKQITPPANTELRFFAIEHGDDSNTDYIAEVLKDTDIYFPEINSWDPLTAKFLQKVSNGDAKARQKMLESSSSGYMAFTNAMIRGLYNTRANVRMADLPNTSSIPDKLSRMAYINGGLSQSAFSLMAERDKHIANTICNEISLAQQEVPRFRDKTIKATAIFGVGHFSVASALQDAVKAQNSESFSINLLFTEEAASATGADVIDYANWLRTED